MGGGGGGSGWRCNWRVSPESVSEPATSKFLSRASSTLCRTTQHTGLVQKAHDAIPCCVVSPNKQGLSKKPTMLFHAVSYHPTNRACPKSPRCYSTLCRTTQLTGLVQKAHDAFPCSVVSPNKQGLSKKPTMLFHAVSYHPTNRAGPKSPRCYSMLCRITQQTGLVQKAHDAIPCCVVSPNKQGLSKKPTMLFHAVSYHPTKSLVKKNHVALSRCVVRTTQQRRLVVPKSPLQFRKQ